MNKVVEKFVILSLTKDGLFKHPISNIDGEFKFNQYGYDTKEAAFSAIEEIQGLYNDYFILPMYYVTEDNS